MYVYFKLRYYSTVLSNCPQKIKYIKYDINNIDTDLSKGHRRYIFNLTIK